MRHNIDFCLSDSRCLLCYATSQWLMNHVWQQRLLGAEWMECWATECGALPDTKKSLLNSFFYTKYVVSLLLFVSFATLFSLFISSFLLHHHGLHKKGPTMVPVLAQSVLLHNLCPFCITRPNGPHTLCSFTNVAFSMKP